MAAPVSSSVSQNPVHGHMKVSYNLLRDPVNRGQVQHILDHVKRLGSLNFQLKALMEEQPLHLLRDGTRHATIFVIMEDCLVDDFGITRCARVIHIRKIAARGACSAPILSQAQFAYLPWPFEDFSGSPRVQGPEHPRVLSKELKDTGIVFDGNNRVGGFWPFEGVAVGKTGLGQDFLHADWGNHPKPEQVSLTNAFQDSRDVPYQV
jgi:hypothetical protein